jgi:capsular polysaccharide export protein
MKRTHRYLFLQGNASRFFDRLGRALDARGDFVRRIHFTGGDQAFWSLPGAVSFTGTLAQWPAFLAERLRQWQITDIVLFGDCRPLHQVAIASARPLGICVHVCDEGYLRPHWITVEEGGINGHSPLRHRSLALFRRTAAFLPSWVDAAAVPNSGLRRAIDDVRYLAWSGLLWWRYRNYRTHRPHAKLVEYAGGARRLIGRPIAGRLRERDVARIRESGQPHFVFPLQLEADSQIRFHSRFPSITAAIDRVIRSFAAHAPPASLLAITEHPLETSLQNWRRVVHDIARQCGVGERVFFLQGGTPDLLLQECRGVVTINSTIGSLALTLGRPVITLGEAIYDMEGLTFQRGLDAFWHEGAPADRDGVDAFRRVVAAQTQVNGGYFSDRAIELAVTGLLARWDERQRLTAPVARVVPMSAAEPMPFPDLAVSSAREVVTSSTAAGA